MVLEEFEKSGKKDYLINYLSKIIQSLSSDIKKFNWSSTKSLALTSKITYNTFRYVIDKWNLYRTT